MTEPDETSGDVELSDLDDLEERVAAIFELPDSVQAAAFARLRQRFPKAANVLLRWERAAFAIDAARRDVSAVATAMQERGPTQQPERIGAYKILDVLGEGGMGVVYLAEQQEPVRRRVALKVIRAGMDGKDVLARFEAERQALAMMSHPNIAKVLDAGETPDGQPYFALEHVPGVPITEYCDRQKLGIDSRIELFQKVCLGVQHAHQKGVIHRDLKPGNILVQIRDGFAEPKIIDFGVAKAVQQRLTERTLYTEQGRILGTPEYMSPEQAEMSGLDIDTRSDIYSLGVLLYELLSGDLPFASQELRQAGYFEMQRKIREDEPERPSTRCSTRSGEELDIIAARRRTDPRNLAKALHGDLDWIAMRCLEKDPARRYQTASELGADLQRSLDDEPVEAGPPSAWYRFAKFVRKHRGPVLAAAGIFLALTVGLGIALWQRSEAVANEELARTNETLATAAAQRARQAEQEAKENLTLGEKALRQSRALNIAAAADRALDQDPIIGLQLAQKAVEIDRTPETLSHVQIAMAEQFLYAECAGHKRRITCSDFAPGKRRIVTGSADNTVRLWTEEGEELAVLPQDGFVVAVRFSDDEQKILVLCRRRNLMARSFALDGTLLQKIDGVGDRRLAVADWNADGSRLLVQFDRRSPVVALLDAEGREVRQLEPGAQLVHSFLRFSPQGHAVRITAREATIWRSDGSEPIRLRAAGSGADAVAEFYLAWQTPGRIAFDPQGELIATIHTDDVVRLWNHRGQRVATLREHTNDIREVRFSPTGDQILTASQDGTARLWSRRGERRQVLTPGGELWGARFVGSDRRVLTDGTSSLTLWTDTGRELVRLSGAGPFSLAAVDAPTGFVLRNRSERAQVWRLGGVAGAHLRCDGNRPWKPAYHPDGSILCGSEGGRLFAWDEDGKLIREFGIGEVAPLYGIAISPDGTRIAAGGNGGRLFLWDWQDPGTPSVHRLMVRHDVIFALWLRSGRIWAQTNARQAFLIDPLQRTHKLVFDRKKGLPEPLLKASEGFFLPELSPDGRTIGVTAWGSGHVLLLDGDGRLLTDFQAHEAGGLCMAFHKNGEWIATGSRDRTVKIWERAAILANPRTVQPVRTIAVPGGVNFVSFAPDGTGMLIATGSRAYVTDLEGRVRFHFWPRGGRTGYLSPAIRISPDGKWIYGKAYDGLRRWPARESDLLQLARKRMDRLGVARDLSRYEHLWQDAARSGAARDPRAK